MGMAAKLRSTERGQSLVELALSLPLLLLILLGTVDLGRAFFDYVELRNAAREGAGYGARRPEDRPGIEERVRRHGVPADAAVGVTCSTVCAVAPGAGTVTVTASRTFEPVATGFLQAYFGLDPFELRASATMRILT
jgi:Flp pilus assembly protein TadG